MRNLSVNRYEFCQGTDMKLVSELQVLTMNKLAVTHAGVFILLLHRTDESQEGRNSCLWLQILACSELLMILVH